MPIKKHNIPTLRFEVDYFENIKNIHDIYSDKLAGFDKSRVAVEIQKVSL